MALRFRRSFRLAPGLRINFSGSGASLSVGPRGASASFGRRGTFLNTGIPGTGLYSRERLGSSPARRSASSSSPGKITQAAVLSVGEDGAIQFLDGNGQPLSEEWIARAKRQKGEEIRAQIQKVCDEINAKVEALGSIHVKTPAPNERLRYEPQEFEEAAPSRVLEKPYGVLGRLFKSTRAKIDAYNAGRQAEYELQAKRWHIAKENFAKAELARKELLEVRVLTDVQAMEEILESSLKAIEWPRETTISAEINDGGWVVLLDVDLPELEDMPKTTASVPSRGYKLTVKEMSAAKIQKLYMQHVHGIGFRIIGEAFAALPNAQDVILSTFSQRPDKATGAVTDEYLYSARVKRDDWKKINFESLDALDVITALERFELRREMSKTGVFRPIDPLIPSRGEGS